MVGVGGFAIALTACGRGKTAARPVPAGSTVLALGDSLTAGNGASAETAYPAVLAGLTGWNVVNAGVSGDTSAQALARLPALLAEHAPKLVIVSIGGNDFLRQLPESDTRAHVHAICQQALDSGAQVLLVAVPRATVAAALGQMTDHAMYAEVAKDLKIPLQREGWGEVLSQPDLRADQVHANARGYAQFARSVQGTAAAAGLLPR
ncbi:arylesterase [Ottowia testudinis]|uniref:Arylesterase n=1 Tax=Ottowia testudinis TaxID=2816950 RepID=A0A975H500_9BURK|nr:arylesterase [Ottowia testudinis]